MIHSVFHGKKVMITAGPTREAIDPVRYISNHSSGKMGYALASAFLEKGARVTLISGPVNLSLQHDHLVTIPVHSAVDMLNACRPHFEEADIFVFAAAVADYRPEKASTQKIKKDGEELLIRMVKNPDIAFDFGKIKMGHQLSVGFALETNDELAHARAKLARKNFDLVVLNSMNDPQATFGFDTNKITLLRADHTQKNFSLKNKSEVATDIVNEIATLLIQPIAQSPVLRDHD